MVFIDATALLILGDSRFRACASQSAIAISIFSALIWIVLTMAPALNLNSILWLVDDRYLYAPSFGWSLAVAVAAVEIALTGPSLVRQSAPYMTMMLALYVVSAMRIERYWHDDVAYFNRTVEIAPSISAKPVLIWPPH